MAWDKNQGIKNDASYLEPRVTQLEEVRVTTIRETVVLNNDTSIVEIPIEVYSKKTDILLVFVNSTYIELSQDYTLDNNGKYINKMDGSWESGSVINFIVFKYVSDETNVIVTDGSQLADDSVANRKLDPDIKIGSLSTLQTSAKSDVVSAINETKGSIGDKTSLPQWLQDSLYEVVKVHDDYLRQFGVNITQPPYNAPADGSDVTAIVQQAIDDLPTINTSPLMKNGVIYFPYGKYGITNLTVPMGVTLMGSQPVGNSANPYSRSNGSVIIVLTTSGDCIKVKGDYLKGSGNHIAHLKFTGGQGQGTNALTIGDTFTLRVRECVFEHLDVENAIYQKDDGGGGSRWLFLDNVFMKIIGDSGGYTYGDGFNLISTADSYLNNCVAESCGGVGLRTGSGNITITSSWFDLNNIGMQLLSSDIFIVNTQAKLNQKSGVIIDGGADRIVIDGCHFYENGRAENGINHFGIEWLAGKLIVNSSVIGKSSDIYQKGGIKVAAGATTGVIDSNIINNGGWGAIYNPDGLLETNDIKIGLNDGVRNDAGESERILTSDGVKTSWRINHTLARTPKKFGVTPASATATGRQNSEKFYVTVDSTALTITFIEPPINGANPQINWWAEL